MSASGAQARALVMRCGAFGDMVLLTALLRRLLERFGQPADIICSGAWSRPLLAGQPGVGEIFVLGSRKAPYWLSAGQRRLVSWLRRRGAGPTWYCDPGPGRDLLGRAGIPDSFVCEDRALAAIPGEHFVERWLRLADATPPAFAGRLASARNTPRRAAALEIDAAAELRLAPWLARRGLADRGLILIQAGNKRTMRGLLRRRATNTKYWPEARWAEVVRALRAACPEHAVLLLGVAAEYALNAQIAELAGGSHVYNVADDLPVPTLLPLLARAHSLVSVDTGPAHAAAALGCPTVALFGTSNPELYRPGGVDTPAIALTGERGGQRDILGIEAGAVIAAWRELTRERR